MVCIVAYFKVISIHDYVNIHKPLSPDIVPALTKSTTPGNWVLDTQTLIDETFLFFVSSSWYERVLGSTNKPTIKMCMSKTYFDEIFKKINRYALL